MRLPESHSLADLLADMAREARVEGLVLAERSPERNQRADGAHALGI